MPEPTVANAPANDANAPALRVLVIEDSALERMLVVRVLTKDGLSVDEAAGSDEAHARIIECPPDVVVLDLGLPDGGGLDLLRELVAEGTSPVVVLSGRGNDADRVLGLELGAEDYMVKPYLPRELAARVRRAVDRTRSIRHAHLEAGGLVIDRDSREVSLDGTEVMLADREFDLLVHLVASPRRVFSRDDLLRDVWQSSPEWQTAKTVTEHIRRLRQKLEDDPHRPQRIITVGNAGYRFDPPTG